MIENRITRKLTRLRRDGKPGAGAHKSHTGTWLVLLAACGCSGCSENHGGSHMDPGFDVPIRVAVAPALNFSGRGNFDSVQIADLMASELGQFRGVHVIGVSRVLAVLADQGTDRILSPKHALEVCERLGADDLLVFAVTEFDAYTPVVGLAAQLYGEPREIMALDPVAASRSARPFPVVTAEERYRPRAQVQRVFNGDHDEIRDDVEAYAGSRGEEESVYGWRRYLVSQRHYLRYCCQRVAADLMRQKMDFSARMVVAVGDSGI